MNFVGLINHYIDVVCIGGVAITADGPHHSVTDGMSSDEQIRIEDIEWRAVCQCVRE